MRFNLWGSNPTMDTLRLKPREPVEEDEVENWDDDDFMIDNDDLTMRSATTSVNQQLNRRESHASFRSDRDSLAGDDETHVHLPGDDEKSRIDAIAAAASAGIPIPQNVPPSALMGGTIKRLGGRKLTKMFQEDWGDDLELPKNGQKLRIKPQDGSNFPDVLRTVSGSSPAKPVAIPAMASPDRKENKPMKLASPINLDRYRDDDDDDDVFGDDGSTTIKATKVRPPTRHISTISPPTPLKMPDEDDFEADLELPPSGKLNLANLDSRKDAPNTPSLSSVDDFDWGEGSLGTRFGGTRRGALSNRSSSVSALSPSIASSITGGSEDEAALDGLVLPQGPLDLAERLKRRKEDQSPERPSEMDKRVLSSKRDDQIPEVDEDPLDGLDFGDGDLFNTAKINLHRNVQVKDTRQVSPSRPKTAVSITFSNKPVPSTVSSRLPRPMTSGHERSHTLEPVSESGGPLQLRPTRRSQSRFGHSAQSSTSSAPAPSMPSTSHSPTPSTPRRRELGHKASTGTLRNEATTTNAQLLRVKRSLPVLRPPASPARVNARGDWTSRADAPRPQSNMRPKTPPERLRPAYEGSATQARKNYVPFLPAGASTNQSQHVATKSSRTFRRYDSDLGPELPPLSRAASRSGVRSPSPRRARHVEKAAGETWHQLSKPRRVRRFGDGHELDGFDDLPTSAHAESKFTKQPIPGGSRSDMKTKLYQNTLPDRTSAASPMTPLPTANLPHFARDTAASRMAREAALAQRTPSGSHYTPYIAQRVSQLSSKPTLAPHPPRYTSIRGKKSRKPPQLKPHLISNLNSDRESKVVNGMTYNPETFRWEGNETVLNAFDVPASSPAVASMQYSMREKDATPRPVLITNMSATKGVKRVGDMVFDPQQMCWLKVDAAAPAARADDPMDGFDAMDEEDDVFKDIPDLADKDPEAPEGRRGRSSDVRDDWLVGEEFDVGPEFVRRQREEEERWRKKCERWISTVERDDDMWRWALRDIVYES